MSAQGDIQWFEYTLTVQKKYYRAVYERNLDVLRKGTDRRNLPRLTNIEIELRKYFKNYHLQIKLKKLARLKICTYIMEKNLLL